LEETIDFLKNIPLNKKEEQVKSNISSADKRVLSDLDADKSIIIKEANKGGTVVVLDRTFYKKKIEEMLQNENYYCKTKPVFDTETRKLIDTLLKIMKINCMQTRSII